MNRTSNRKALPPFRVMLNEKSLKWVQMPSDVWKLELETCIKDKGFRGNQNTDIILPFVYMGRYLMCVWDCDSLRRDLLLFKEIELSKEQWKAVSTIYNVIVPYIR